MYIYITIVNLDKRILDIWKSYVAMYIQYVYVFIHSYAFSKIQPVKKKNIKPLQIVEEV